MDTKQDATTMATGAPEAPKYGKPTYRRYCDPGEQWQEWKRQAHALDYDDVRRHAQVSTGNRHRCHDCFCCACVEYVLEHNRQM